ncbi:MAG: hypothetical protein ABJN40_20140 [Sneathiella sp.]
MRQTKPLPRPRKAVIQGLTGAVLDPGQAASDIITVRDNNLPRW